MSAQRPSPGSRRSGAISASGNNTKFRSAMPGCGTVRVGVLDSVRNTPVNPGPATRGPQRTSPRSRPWRHVQLLQFAPAKSRRLKQCQQGGNGVDEVRLLNCRRTVPSDTRRRWRSKRVSGKLGQQSHGALDLRAGSSRLLPRPDIGRQPARMVVIARHHEFMAPVLRGRLRAARRLPLSTLQPAI